MPQHPSARGLFALVIIAALAATAGCGADSTVAPANPPGSPGRVLTTVRLSLEANPIEVGQQTRATAETLDQYGEPIAADSVTYTSSESVVAVVGPTTGRIFAIAPGSTVISATIDGKFAQRTITVFKAPIRVNEIRPDGDGPGGWVELVNPSAYAFDASRMSLTASDVFQTFELPAGSVIPAGGFLVVDETSFPAGLHSVDTVHLFGRFGVHVDSHIWAENPTTSLGRCPDGTGALELTATPTRGATNACAPEGP